MRVWLSVILAEMLYDADLDGDGVLVTLPSFVADGPVMVLLQERLGVNSNEYEPLADMVIDDDLEGDTLTVFV